MQLSFLQSNWYRQYPFKKGAGEIDVHANVVPTDLIVGMRISAAAGDVNLYIKKIVTNNNVVSIEIFGGSAIIATAAGLITESNQSLIITAISGGVCGTITIGNPDSTIARQVFEFDASTGAIESSVVTVITSPALSLIVKGKILTGMVTLASSSVSIDTQNGINLSLIAPENTAARGDKQAMYLTCDNSIIGGINTVLPDENGNIDLYGIAPVVITSGLQLTTPGITRATIGKPYNIPPANAADTSPGAITGSAEFKTWPQFN